MLEVKSKKVPSESMVTVRVPLLWTDVPVGTGSTLSSVEPWTRLAQVWLPAMGVGATWAAGEGAVERAEAITAIADAAIAVRPRAEDFAVTLMYYLLKLDYREGSSAMDNYQPLPQQFDVD
jgi:hypothetical protein